MTFTPKANGSASDAPFSGSRRERQNETLRALAGGASPPRSTPASPGLEPEARNAKLGEVFAPARRKSAPAARTVAQSPCVKKLLCETMLFRDVPSQEFERFYERLRWRQVSAGTRLLTGGECSPWVFLLVEGTAKVHHESAQGAQVIYSICGPGEVLGEMSAVDGQAHSATVSTLEASTLGAVSREEFLSFLLCVPQASLNIAAITSLRLRAATARIESLSRLDVTGRLAAQLLLFAAHYGYTSPGTNPELQIERAEAGSRVAIDLHLRQSDLADLIGASRVRVNQALHQMRRLGHIAVQGNRITLLDLAALRARCQ